MELTCEDPDASSAPSCRLTRFSEFVPNDRILDLPLFLSGITASRKQLRYAPTRGIRHGPRFVRWQTGLTSRNRAKTRSVRNCRSGSFGCTPPDRAFLGTPIAMCVFLKQLRHGFSTGRRAGPESSR